MTNGTIKHAVAITSNGDTCTVAPERLMVNVGDIVVFQNITESPVILFFPTYALFEETTVTLPKGNDAELDVHNVPLAEYPYTVYFHGKEKFVDKAAMPTVIVYRKIS